MAKSRNGKSNATAWRLSHPEQAEKQVARDFARSVHRYMLAHPEDRELIMGIVTNGAEYQRNHKTNTEPATETK